MIDTERAWMSKKKALVYRHHLKGKGNDELSVRWFN